MKENWKSILAITLIASFLYLIYVYPTGKPDKPEWISKEAFYHDRKAKAFFGVGSVSGVANAPLAIDTAERRARWELRRGIMQYLNSLLERFEALPAEGWIDREHVRVRFETLAAAIVSSARLLDPYVDSPTHSYYASAKITADDIESMLKTTDDLPDDLRSFMIVTIADDLQ